MDILATFKQVIANYMNNAKLCDVFYGTVTGANIKLDNSFTIPSDMVAKLKMGSDSPPLQTGSRVALIRSQGGQLFTLLGVVE